MRESQQCAHGRLLVVVSVQQPDTTDRFVRNCTIRNYQYDISDTKLTEDSGEEPLNLHNFPRNWVDSAQRFCGAPS